MNPALKKCIDAAINRNIVVYDNNAPSGTLSLNLFNLMRQCTPKAYSITYVVCNSSRPLSKTEELIANPTRYSYELSEYDLTKYYIEVAKGARVSDKKYCILAIDSDNHDNCTIGFF